MKILQWFIQAVIEVYMDSVGKRSSGPKFSSFIGNNFRNDFFLGIGLNLFPKKQNAIRPLMWTRYNILKSSTSSEYNQKAYNFTFKETL